MAKVLASYSISIESSGIQVLWLTRNASSRAFRPTERLFRYW